MYILIIAAAMTEISPFQSSNVLVHCWMVLKCQSTLTLGSVFNMYKLELHGTLKALTNHAESSTHTLSKLAVHTALTSSGGGVAM